MVIDIHTHITTKHLPAFRRLLKCKPFTTKTLLTHMDKDGIEKSVVLPMGNPENLDIYAIAGNLETIAECNKHRDRLIPFCNIDPRGMLHDSKADFSKLIRVFKELGCLGIGEICANMPISHRLYKNLFYHAGEQKMPLLFHFAGRRGKIYGVIDDIHLPGLEQMLKEFPRTIFIGHGPAFWSEIDWNVSQKTRDGYPKGPIKKRGVLWRLLEEYANLYSDLSAGSGQNALTRDVEVGYSFLQKYNKKLFFGTDRFTPTRDCPEIVVLLRGALSNRKITKRAYDNIMSGNFNRVIVRGRK